jgi:hypothetical protein
MDHSDFYLCYNFVLANWFVYSDSIQREMQKVRRDLRQELGCWHPGQPEPDWSGYAERMNMICRDSGFPVPFVAPSWRGRAAPRRQSSRRDPVAVS